VDLLLDKLDPEIKLQIEQIGPMAVDSASLDEFRTPPRAAAGLPDDLIRSDAVAEADGQSVKVRIHQPPAGGDNRPCIYSIHGGGYVVGSHEGDDAKHQVWCTALGTVGVAVGYRLAPEATFPGPLEDCYAGLVWTYRNAERLGIDSKRIGILGDSAGGGLAASLALMARDRAEVPVAFQVLRYPMLDDRQTTASSAAAVPIWQPHTNAFGWRSYLGALYGTADLGGYAVAARATDLSGLPPTLIIAGDLDGFLDEDIDYARRLTGAGVLCDLHVLAGAPHGFFSLLPDAPVSRRARAIVDDWLAQRLSR
jgi:triacylglycerol lipase